MNVEQFASEEDFERWFYEQGDPTTQIKSLHEWRKRQERIAPALRGMVRLLANEQYTQRDHFLLELLQNADDNTYADGATPTLSITLREDRCIFECNEKGFTAENVFAICYAAASTKARDKSARTFIGEKGIGFKSIFAIASTVEIHSGLYHFELRDGEYVLPHLLEGEAVEGSRIIIHFKEGMDDLAESLSERLQDLSQESQHFLLFLQNLEKLTICDEISGGTTTVEVIRAQEEKRFLVQNGQDTKIFHVEAFEIQMPADVVNSRFDDLNEQLPREIIFAVPLPEALPEDGGGGAGRLFCFLPTEVSTGLPFHIQIDAKTVTNREDIADCNTSDWNAFVLKQLREKLGELFLRLKSSPDFLDHLPRYLPQDPDEIDLKNSDLEDCIRGFCEDIAEKDLFLDRHGDTRPASLVRQAPEGLAEWVETEQYETHLSLCSEEGEGGEDRADVTFLHSGWRKFGDVLENYGCRRLKGQDFVTVMTAGGVPEGIVDAEESDQRLFLESVMANKNCCSSKLWRECPVFPVRTAVDSAWGKLGTDTLLVVSESQNPNVAEGVTIVDPRFTFTPGSGRRADEVRDFNNTFRDFVGSFLEVERFTEARYLEQVLVEGMIRDPKGGALSDKDREALTDQWVELYYRIWRRRTSIIDDTSEKRWEALIEKIGNCVIPVSIHDEESPGEHWEGLLKRSFLPDQLGGMEGLEEAYSTVGAPFVAIDIEGGTERYWARQARRRETEIDFSEWRDFLVAAKGLCHGYLRKVNLGILRAGGSAMGPTEDFLEEVREDTPCHGERGFQLRDLITDALDPFTGALLSKRPIPEVVTRGISALWPRIAISRTDVKYLWGQKWNDRSHSYNGCFARYQIGAPLRVQCSDGSFEVATKCFIDTPGNHNLSEGILPLVDPQRYGGSKDFMLEIGVKPEITYETASDLVVGWHANLGFENTAGGFAPLLEVLVRLGQKGPGERTWLRARKVFYYPDSDELLPYTDWEEAGGPEFFTELLRVQVVATFGEKELPSASELIAELQSIGDLIGNPSHLGMWFRKASGAFDRGEGEELAEAFSSHLESEGLLVCGDEIKSLKALPVVWDRTPGPVSASSVILLPDDPAERHQMIQCARRLGWPLLSRSIVQVEVGEPTELDPRSWKHLELAYRKLLGLFEKAGDASVARLRELPFSQSWRTFDKTVMAAEDLGIGTIIDGASQASIEVPYWRAKGICYLNLSSRNLPEAVAHLIDCECEVTIAPFFAAIWDQTAPEIEEFDPDAHDDGENPKIPETPGGGGGGGGTKEGTSVEDLLGGDGNGSDKDPGKDDKVVNGAGSDDTRKRLFSYVMPPGSGGTSKGGGNAAGKNQTRNDETEVAGAKKLREFFESRGLECVSVEAENVGYDFEVTVGERKLLIELKTSRAKWRNWEHSLSPNEFKVALEKGANYFLCVIDRVFEDSCEIYFIQNPAGKADGFLFDAPWKSMGMKMSDMITRIKAEEGVIED